MFCLFYDAFGSDLNVSAHSLDEMTKDIYKYIIGCVNLFRMLIIHNLLGFLFELKPVWNFYYIK